MLEGALADAVERNEDPTVVLRIAKNLTVQDLVDVMSIAAKLNLKMVLSTER
jgi:biopolymer transport protein ExbD